MCIRLEDNSNRGHFIDTKYPILNYIFENVVQNYGNQYVNFEEEIGTMYPVCRIVMSNSSPIDLSNR